MWGAIGSFLVKLITDLLSRFIFKKTVIEQTKTEHVYNKGNRTEVNTLSVDKLLRKNHDDAQG